MGEAARSIHDYTMKLVKQEWIGNSLSEEEALFVKWARPLSFYYRRLTEPHKGREVMYVLGWNHDKLRVSLGTFPNLSLNLDPFGALAMSGGGRPVTETSLVYLVDVVLKNFLAADRQGRATVKMLGEETILGRPCVRLEVSAPKGGSDCILQKGETLWDIARKTGQSIAPILHANREKGWKDPEDARAGDRVFVPRYYASRIDLSIDRELNLPVRALIYDNDGMLFERFEHRDLRVNVGLTARDFDPKNPAYRF